MKVEKQSAIRIDHTSAGWGELGDSGECSALPEAILRLIKDRPMHSPVDGFGRLYLRTYRATLTGTTWSAQQVFAALVNQFPAYWPEGNYFLPCAARIEPGALCAILLSMPMGLRLVTGARVMYLDETSFSLMTLQGHMFAGWITFSAYQEDGQVGVQVQALVRPGDVLFEVVYRLGFGMKAEDNFWHTVLRNFSQSIGVEPKLQQENQTIAGDLIWRNFGNLWYNASLRSIPRFYGRSFNTLLNQPVIK